MQRGYGKFNELFDCILVINWDYIKFNINFIFKKANNGRINHKVKKKFSCIER